MNTDGKVLSLKIIIVSLTIIIAASLRNPPLWFQEFFYEFIQPIMANDFSEFLIIYFGILPMFSLMLYYLILNVFFKGEIIEKKLDLIKFGITLYIILSILFIFIFVFDALKGLERMTQ